MGTEITITVPLWVLILAAVLAVVLIVLDGWRYRLRERFWRAVDRVADRNYHS